jgi:putative membrane protein
MLIYFFIGIALGVIAGLVPGLHPNLIAFQLKNIPMDSMAFAIILISASSANIVFSFIPMIFFFIPNETVLGVLPGHFLARKGEGFKALKICVFSVFLAVLFSLVFAWLNFSFSREIFATIKPAVPIILILFSVFLLVDEGKKAIIPFFLSGILGYIILTYSKMREPIFIPFLGFFSLSMIFLSKKEKIKKQKDEKLKIKKEIFILVILGSFLGWICDFFPAISSPAQMATFIFPVIKGPEDFLSVTSAIITSHAINSIVSLVSIKKARTGITIATKDIINEKNILFFILVSCTAFFISIFLILLAAKEILRYLQNVNQFYLNIAIAAYAFLISFISDGFFGIFVLLVCTAIGIFTQLCGARRTNMMAFLLLPVIINSL